MLCNLAAHQLTSHNLELLDKQLYKFQSSFGNTKNSNLPKLERDNRFREFDKNG